jgi:hypothetical protein
MMVDTSTIHLRAAPAWVRGPEVIHEKIAHLGFARNTRSRRRPDPLLSSATAMLLAVRPRGLSALVRFAVDHPRQSQTQNGIGAVPVRIDRHGVRPA